MPASSTTPTYRAAYRFATNTPGTAVTAGTWSAPVVVAQNGAPGADGADGADGIDGMSVARVFIYQRAASTPSLPSATATYTFATGGITGLNNGWMQDIPAGSNPLWVSLATAASAGTTDTIGSGEWAGAVVLAENGAPGSNGSNGSNGSDGLNSATVYLFQRTATSTPPSLPSATVTYTFSTGVATGMNNGWVQSLPTTGGPYRWVTTASALSAGTTDTLGSGEWATASILAEDGATGNKVVRVYKRSLNAPSTPTGDGVPSTWFVAPPAADGNRLWMSEAEQTVAGVLVGSWSTPVEADATAPPGVPAMLNGVLAYGYSVGGTAYAGIKFKDEGSVWLKDDSSAHTDESDDWYAPNASGVGSSYWVRVMLNSGASLTSGTLNTWLALSGEPEFLLSRGTTGLGQSYLGISISSSSTGIPIVGTGTYQLQVERS